MRRRSASELQFDQGDRVGPYQITRRVAPSCYDAETLASGTPVRIELATADDHALIDVRFSRAQAQLGLVDHPCVAQILDHGVLSNGRPWVASERPAGTALSDVLAQRRLEPREVTALIYSVAQVLAFAHHRQVVHGALRPHHLTLSRGAKVSISGWAWLRSPGIPAFGDPANTSVYNPPEHDGQSPIDGRADVYALGAIAYRALTGVFPDVSRDLLDPHEPLGAAIENMLSLDARDRNSAAAIVADLHEQRIADRAAAKERAAMNNERASMQELDVRAPSQNEANDDDRLARAEKEIEELRAQRASSPQLKRRSSPTPHVALPHLVEADTRDDNRPSARMTAVHGAQDIESRRTKPIATPSRGLARTTRPMSTVEYAALDTDASVAIERGRRFISIQSALHDIDEPRTDRMAAGTADQECTDIAPQTLDPDETDIVPAQDPTDRTAL